MHGYEAYNIYDAVTLEKVNPFPITGNMEASSYEVAMLPALTDSFLIHRGSDGLYCVNIFDVPIVPTTLTFDTAVVYVKPGESRQLHYTLRDQVGALITNHSYTEDWSVMGEGSVDSTGVYTAASQFSLNNLIILTLSGMIPNTSTYFELKDTMIVNIKATQTITAPAVVSYHYNSAAFDPGAVASSGLPVTYTKISGAYNLVDNKVVPLGVTSIGCKLSASQPGNEIYLPATNVLVMFNLTSTGELITSLEDKIDGEGIIIYPNPAKDIIFIKNAQSSTRYEIVNIIGKRVMSFNGSDAEVNVSSLSQGVYFIKSNINNEVKKILINK